MWELYNLFPELYKISYAKEAHLCLSDYSLIPASNAGINILKENLKLTGKMVTDKAYNISDQRTAINFNLHNSRMDYSGSGGAVDLLIAEGGESFYNYVDWLGLSKDPDLIVLSSQRHYYYDAEELNNVKTVINMKELNQIKQIKDFLHSIYNILPQKSNFIGCFIDNTKISQYVLRNSSSSQHKEKSTDDIENGIVSAVPFINRLFSIMDSKTNVYLSESSVTFLLEDFGFRVMDMTLINGFTYFHSQKVRIDYMSVHKP